MADPESSRRWYKVLIPQKIEIPTIISLVTAGLYFIGHTWHRTYLEGFGIPIDAVPLPLETIILLSFKILVPYLFLVGWVIMFGLYDGPPETTGEAFAANVPFLMGAAVLVLAGWGEWVDPSRVRGTVFVPAIENVQRTFMEFFPFIKMGGIVLAQCGVLAGSIYIAVRRVSLSRLVMGAGVAARLGAFLVSLIVLYWFAAVFGSLVATMEIVGLKSRHLMSIEAKEKTHPVHGKTVYLIALAGGRYVIYERNKEDILNPHVWLVPEGEIAAARVRREAFDFSWYKRLHEKIF